MLRLVVILTVVLAARRADAQIVNVQGQLAKAPDKDGIVAQLEGKLDWRTGNNPLFQVGGLAALIIHRGKWLGLALVRGDYGESRGVTLSRKTFEHLRGRYTIDCRWKWEAFAQHEYDAFRRLSIRTLAGTGPVLQIINEKTIGVMAGAAYMFEFEQLGENMLPDGRVPIDAGDRTVFHRASFYVTGVEKLGSHVAIVQTLYAQPRLDEPNDVRLLAELSITMKITKRIALTDGLTIAYDRTPPDGVERADTQLTIGLIASF
jgi:hypothetical protein